MYVLLSSEYIKERKERSVVFIAQAKEKRMIG